MCASRQPIPASPTGWKETALGKPADAALGTAPADNIGDAVNAIASPDRMRWVPRSRLRHSARESCSLSVARPANLGRTAQNPVPGTAATVAKRLSWPKRAACVVAALFSAATGVRD
jgi:hypothetical protein